MLKFISRVQEKHTRSKFNNDLMLRALTVYGHVVYTGSNMIFPLAVITHEHIKCAVENTFLHYSSLNNVFQNSSKIFGSIYQM